MVRWPVPFLVFLVLATIVAVATIVGGRNEHRDVPHELRFELTAEARYIANQPIIVHFKLFGDPKSSLRVLRWNTPLEGIRGRIFKVTRGGSEVAYSGALFKRGDPAREDYLLLPAAGELHADVDLGSAYAMQEPGNYTVTLVGGLLDVAPAQAVLPRRRDQFTELALRGDPVIVRVVRP